MKCENCEYWLEDGVCRAVRLEKLVVIMNSGYGRKGCDSYLVTSKDFGCVLHSRKHDPNSIIDNPDWGII